MSTSVKLAEDDKEKLEKLQALVVLKLGEKMTQQELLAKLIQDAFARGDGFIESMKPNAPMSDDGFGKAMSLVKDWGVETRWEEIDRVLYGGKKGKR